MRLRKDAEPVFDVVDLEVGKPDFLECGTLRDRIGNGYFLSGCMVFDRDLDDLFGIALNGSCVGSVDAKRRCRMSTGREAYGAHWARITCAGAAAQQVAQGFRDIARCDEAVRTREGLELLEDSRERTLLQSSSSSHGKSWLWRLRRGEWLPEIPASLRAAVLAITASPLTLAKR